MGRKKKERKWQPTLGKSGWMNKEATADLAGSLGDGAGITETLGDLEGRIKRQFLKFMSGDYVLITFISREELYLTGKERKDVTDDRSIGITKYNFLRNRAGLYGYVSHEDKWYIGEAKNLAERFSQHRYDKHKLDDKSYGFAVCRITGTRGDDFLANPAVRRVIETATKRMFFESAGKDRCSFALKKGEDSPRIDSYQIISIEAKQHVEQLLGCMVTIFNKNERERVVKIRSTFDRGKVPSADDLFNLF